LQVTINEMPADMRYT